MAQNDPQPASVVGICLSLPVRWLFTADDTLPGTPIQAIAEHRGTEVNRRAQALAY